MIVPIGQKEIVLILLHELASHKQKKNKKKKNAAVYSTSRQIIIDPHKRQRKKVKQGPLAFYSIFFYPKLEQQLCQVFF
jgi:hypothetical protein